MYTLNYRYGVIHLRCTKHGRRLGAEWDGAIFGVHEWHMCIGDRDVTCIVEGVLFT